MSEKKITTIQQALDLIGVTGNQRVINIVKKLQNEGRSEKSICYSIWKSSDKIIAYKSDNRFYTVLENEIKKWAWTNKDPRWQEKNKRGD